MKNTLILVSMLCGIAAIQSGEIMFVVAQVSFVATALVQFASEICEERSV